MDQEKNNRYYIVELSHPRHENDKFVNVPEYWVIDIEDGSRTILPRGVTEAILEKMNSYLKENNFNGCAAKHKNQDPAKINKEACLNLAYLKELDVLRLRPNGIFENLTGSDLVTSSPELAKVYNSKSTHKPQSMKYIRKSANPTKSVMNQPLVNPSVRNTTANKNPVVSFWEQRILTHKLKNQLTKEIPKCPKPQVAINGQVPTISIKGLAQNIPKWYNIKESSSDDIEMKAEPECSKKNKLNEHKDPSKIINEACLNLKELDALRLRLNGIFEDFAKVCSEIKERIKKLDNFNEQYSDEHKPIDKPVVTSAQEPTPMELEGKDLDKVVIKPFEKKPAILPKDYDKNYCKWTLRYRKKAKGLVELEQGSGIYVSERGLFYCERISRSTKDFARNLLVEVYSDFALRSCSLTGAKSVAGGKTKPVLDPHARGVLLRAVEKHAREQKGEKLETELEIEMHRRRIETTLRYKLIYLRTQYNKHHK